VDKLKVLRSTGAAAWKAHIHTVAEAVHMCCRENHKRIFLDMSHFKRNNLNIETTCRQFSYAGSTGIIQWVV
jgi:hypothetical protein